MTLTPLRSDELQQTVIDRLRVALSVPSTNIIRSGVAAQRDDLDPRITVGATVTSTPENRVEQATGTVSVSVDGTNAYVLAAANSEEPRLKTLIGDIKAEMTRHTKPLRAAGVSDETDVAFEENINRYVGAISFEVERSGAARSAQQG